MALYITEIVVPCGTWFGAKKHRTSGVIIIYDAFLTLFSFQRTLPAVPGSSFILTQAIWCVNIFFCLCGAHHCD